MTTVSDRSADGFSRRRFLANASAVGAIPLLGLPRMAAAEPPPEIRKIRLLNAPIICVSPQFLAEELLHLEGFSEVEYVSVEGRYQPSWRRQSRHDNAERTIPSPGTRRWEPHRHLGWHSSRLLGVVRQRARPRNSGPQGEEHCHLGLRGWRKGRVHGH